MSSADEAQNGPGGAHSCIASVWCSDGQIDGVAHEIRTGLAARAHCALGMLIDQPVGAVTQVAAGVRFVGA